MLRIRQLLAAIFICSTLAITCALAQSSLTQIRDLITNSDGTPFDGMVVITWNGYSVPSGTPVSQLSASASIYNGALSVLLVPTTTAAAGTYYTVVYSSSDGTVTWTETWQVPPSTTALNISQVRQSTTQGSGGTTTGGGQYATLPIAIDQVTDLSSDLSTINTAISTLNTEIADIPTSSTLITLQNTVAALGTTVSGLSTSVAALTTTSTTQATAISGLSSTVGTLNTTVTGLSSTVTTLGSTTSGLTTTVNGLSSTVSGLSATVASNNTSITSLTSGYNTLNTTVSGLSASLTTLNNTVIGLIATVNGLTGNGSSEQFIDAEIPGGSLNGANTTFSLAKTPSPVTSLALYRNGLAQTVSVDYTLAGSVITFTGVSVPLSTDLLQAFYRLPGTGSSTSNFVDAAVPSGTINGANLVFTLATAPSPASSLKLYRNGLLLSQNGDYTISGTTITFASATATPQTGDSFIGSYRN